MFGKKHFRWGVRAIVGAFGPVPKPEKIRLAVLFLEQMHGNVPLQVHRINGWSFSDRFLKMPTQKMEVHK